MKEKILSLINFSIRSRKFLIGESVFSKKTKLVLLAEDASTSSKERYITKLKNLGIDYYVYLTKDEFGQLLNKNQVAAFGFTDINMAKEVKKKIKEEAYGEEK